MAVVGLVRSTCRDPRRMPGEGIAAGIEILPRHAAELPGIEISSHLLVLGWLPDAGRGQHHPHPAPAGSPGHRGVFSTRSARRPNPISLTVVRLVGRHGRMLLVDALDLVDGTPVIDVKPYIPGQDSVFSATRAVRSRTQRGAGTLANHLEAELVRHLGDDATRPAASAAMRAILRAAGAFGVDPRSPSLRAQTNRADAGADALMGLLGASLASGRVVIEPDPGPPHIRFSLEDRVLTLTYGAPDWQPLPLDQEWR